VRLKTDPRSGTYVIIGFGKVEKKGETEELKESKERKPRKTQKSRWRPRQRIQKSAPPPSTPTTPEAVPSESNALEGEPTS
jgi:hypothetical protein